MKYRLLMNSTRGKMGEIVEIQDPNTVRQLQVNGLIEELKVIEPAEHKEFKPKRTRKVKTDAGNAAD